MEHMQFWTYINRIYRLKISCLFFSALEANIYTNYISFMPICPYDGCFTEIDAPPACIVHICDTAGCPNVKKYNYVMCDQHIYDDPKYKNEIFLRDQFNTTVRNVKPIIFQCDDSSIIQSVLV
jgi:hypothetical protein